MYVTVAKTGEIAPGEMTAIDVDGTLVALANQDGTYYAFDDTCTHRQCSLSEGELDETAVTCPCHGSQFDTTTGHAVNGPAFEPVRAYDVRIEGDEIQIDV